MPLEMLMDFGLLCMICKVPCYMCEIRRSLYILL
jgi:hypothetical protein